MTRGEIWWADLPPPWGHRPVLLLSRNQAYAVRGLIIITPLTTRVRNIPAEVRLGLEEGLRRPSVANLDVLTTVPKDSLQEYISTLSSAKLQAVEVAIHFALGLES